MLLALRTVHVAASDVADVVQSEGEPEARVPRKAEQALPTPCDKERVQKKAMRSTNHTFRAHLHRRSPFATYFAANSGAVASAISASSSTTTIRRRFGAGTNFR